MIIHIRKRIRMVIVVVVVVGTGSSPNNKGNSIYLSGTILITNNHKRMEVMIPNLEVVTKLLGNGMAEVLCNDGKRRLLIMHLNFIH